MDSRTFTWCVRPLHMHRWIIMSHNFVTVIKKNWHIVKLVNNLLFTAIGRQKWQFAYLFFRGRRSRHHIFVRIQYPYGNQLEAIGRGKRLLVQQSLLVQLASHSTMLTNRAPQLVYRLVCSILTAASLNLAWYDYFLVEKSLAAFAMFRGRCQQSPQALQMLSVEVPEGHHSFQAERLPEPSFQICCTSHLVHGSSRLHPPIPVESIRRVSSASAETSPCTAVPFWRLCPSPSQVRHLRSACPAQSLHRTHLPHPPHYQNLQDHSDCLR